MKWYEAPTFKLALGLILVIGLVMTTAVSIVDHRFTPQAFILFGAGAVILILGQYISKR
jgi:hypothetical protein